MRFSFDHPIKTTMFGKVTQKKGFWHDGRIAPSFLMVFCTNGDFKMRFLDATYTVREGDILIIPRGTFYQPLQSDGCVYYFFHFSATETDHSPDPLVVKKDETLPVGEYAYSYFPQSEESIEVDYLTRRCSSTTVNGLFERAARLDPYRNATEKLLLDTHLKELLILLSKEASATNGLHPTLQNVTQFIREHYAERLSVATLTKAFRLSASYIARLFRQELGVCPSEYINRVRVDNACTMLLHSDLSIENIAYRVGYSSAYYFSRIFKKLRGCTPQSYRKNHILI